MTTSESPRVALIVMPVVNIDRPSISIAKLRTVLDEQVGDRVDTEVHYLNHDFAEFMGQGRKATGLDLHDVLLDQQHLGLPDWLFRQEAFPETEDNARSYFRRFFPGKSPAVLEIRSALLERREALGDFLEGLIDTYKLDECRIVGFTSLFVQSGAVFAMARRLKARNPDITIIMGGQNCDTPMGEEYARNVEAIDYVFSGPALINLPVFVGHVLDGDLEAAQALKGIFSKTLIDREPADRVGEELDIDVPVHIDYAEFFDSFERFFGDTDAVPQVQLETSRGCWWGERSHCTFCGLNGDFMTYRAMSPQHAIDQYKDLFARYREKSPIFFNVDNILPTNYVDEVLPFIDAPPGTKIFYEVKANMTPQQLKTMSDAGVYWIQPGIEALSSESLELMKKGSTVFVNLRLLKNCLRYGIDPVWSLLVGFPGEGPHIYEKYVTDLPRVTHLRPPKGVGQVHFDRFSPYFFKAEEYGLDLQPVEYYAYCFPFPEESLRNMAYFFLDANFEADHYKHVGEWMDRMQGAAMAWRARWEMDGRDVWEYTGEENQGPKLELHRDGVGEGEGARILDTRFEAPRGIAVDAKQLALLEFLESEKAINSIRRLAGEIGFDADEQLAWLEEHQLVWREGERMLSLVMQPLEDEAAQPAGVGDTARQGTEG